MKYVKLSQPTLVVDRHYEAGAVVEVHDDRARQLLKLGHAEASDGPADAVANPGANALADLIDPEPPGGLTINPADALAPNVEDNPGLKQAARSAAGGKAAKIKRADVVVNPPPPAPRDPATTAAELIAKP